MFCFNVIVKSLVILADPLALQVTESVCSSKFGPNNHNKKNSKKSQNVTKLKSQNLTTFRNSKYDKTQKNTNFTRLRMLALV